jgi:predicted DNA-binding transcriptional regulator AlpA
LIATGYLRLDDQATVLGLSRSTTWTIVQSKHKNTGISASVIKQMLAQPQLPSLARTKIYEYVEQKSLGMYGHKPNQVRRFLEALSPLGPVAGLTDASRNAVRSAALRSARP